MQTPDEIYKDLFVDVQLSGIFKDSKTFVDLIPNAAPEKILADYESSKEGKGFSLLVFINNNFAKQPETATDFKSDTSLPLSEHITKLWPHLTREKDEVISGSSLIPLPKPYIVPGGRFKEIYYWDSYFTMLGLAEDGKLDMIENMIDNFAYLIEEVGYIPNGNRSYFLSRSQPPFFSLMVELLAKYKGQGTIVKYLPFLKQEYDFWMRPDSQRTQQVEGHTLNRYFDNKDFPREESYAEDFALKGNFPHPMIQLRAACESGWDFSSRWFADHKSLEEIRTTYILPVDLNCLLFHLEQMIYNGSILAQEIDDAATFYVLCEKRKTAINTLFYNKKTSFYADYVLEEGISSYPTLAMLYPLFFKLATAEQADTTANFVKTNFLHPGGLPTTLTDSGQQWDFPNGWAPLQWIAVKGLNNYGYTDLARDVAQRWCSLNEKVFASTGKMMEKYNVADLSLMAGGGEYDVQTGFGWSNGVYLAMQAFLK